MTLLVHLIWILIMVLRFAGIIILFAGTAIFGVHFVGGNARAAKSGSGSIPASSWQGRGPGQGFES